MYNNPLRILFTTLVIGSFVFGLSCGSQPTSNTGNANQSANSNANSNHSVSTKADLGKCELALDEPERLRIESEIIAKIRDKGTDKKLKKSLDGDGGEPPWLEFQLRVAPGQMYYEAIFKGAVGGNGQFEELADILNDFNGKKECVRRGIFLPKASGTLAPDQRAVGFEWSACDYPMRPCADGSCACTSMN